MYEAVRQDIAGAQAHLSDAQQALDKADALLKRFSASPHRGWARDRLMEARADVDDAMRYTNRELDAIRRQPSDGPPLSDPCRCDGTQCGGHPANV